MIKQAFSNLGACKKIQDLAQLTQFIDILKGCGSNWNSRCSPNFESSSGFPMKSLFGFEKESPTILKVETVVAIVLVLVLVLVVVVEVVVLVAARIVSSHICC